MCRVCCCGAQDINSDGRLAAIESAGLSLPVYLNIMSPAVGWLVGMVGRGASKETFVEVFSIYKELCGNSMVLKHVIEASGGRGRLQCTGCRAQAPGSRVIERELLAPGALLHQGCLTLSPCVFHCVSVCVYAEL